MAKIPHRAPVVHIVLDTNCLFTEAADKLIASELSKFIREGCSALGAEVKWYLPAIVKAERKHQMLQRGLGLLIPVGKLEALLGHKLGMNPEILAARVEEAIQREITAHGLEVRELNATAVDWSWIIDRAVTRKPPFEAGEREKGFRDAVVLETFLQIVQELPKSATLVRVILLTDDSRLQDAVRERAAEFASASVENDLGSIRTALNAIASHLDQSTIAAIIETAKSMFFSAIDDGLYYRFGLRTWSSRPEVATGPAGFKLGVIKPYINATTFLSKDRQTLHFSTKILVHREAVRRYPRAAKLPAVGLGLKNLQPLGLANIQSLPQAGLGTVLSQSKLNIIDLGLPPIDPSQLTPLSSENIEEESFQGIHEYSVLWKATLTKHGKLIRPSLEDIEYKGVEWTPTASAKI